MKQQHLIFFTIFFLCFAPLSFWKVNGARHEPKDYWKSVMKDEPMPESIKKLYDANKDQSVAASSSSSNIKAERFSKDFGSKSNFIIYHTIGQHQQQDNPHGAAVDDIKPTQTKAKHYRDKKPPNSALHN